MSFVYANANTCTVNSHTHTFGDTVKRLSLKPQKILIQTVCLPFKRPTVTHIYIPHTHPYQCIHHFRENNKQTQSHLSCFPNFSLLLNENHLANESDHFDAPTMNCSHMNCDPSPLKLSIKLALNRLPRLFTSNR